MIEYILLIIISALLLVVTIRYKVNSKILGIVYIIVISFFAANRDINIPDTIGYIELYRELNFDFRQMISSTYMEPGFVVLSIIIKFVFGNNYKIFFFIISFLQMLVVYIGIYYIYNDSIIKIKRDVNYIIPLVLYFTTFGYVFNFITLRYGISFSLVFLSITLYKKSKLKSILLYLLSISFHNSALLLLCTLPFLLSKQNYRKNFFYSWLVLIFPFSIIGYSNVIINSFFVILNKIPFFASRFHAYINESIIVDHRRVFIRLIILMLLGGLVIKNRINKKFDYFLKSYLLGMTILGVFINLSIIGRIVELFLAMIFIIVPINLETRKYLSIDDMILMFCLFYFIISNFRLIT